MVCGGCRSHCSAEAARLWYREMCIRDRLTDIGAACSSSEVLCVRLDDEPGELARVMGVMADCGINVSYSYSLISTYIALSTPDLDRAEELLSGEPVEDVYKRQPISPSGTGSPVSGSTTSHRK